ncbi:MAG: RecX family transcriptional regulator [Pyrinomonadaceae bacterium]|nr:RecX family transcriptional regulator [Pyrinomonadaceae bacterium]
MFRKKWKTKEKFDEFGEKIVVEITDIEKAKTMTMNRAVTLLAAKPRSIGELRQRLLEKSWTNAEIVETVLAKLEEYNYLNDAQFAQSYAASQLRQKAVGKRKLQMTLSRKHLDKETVSDALEKVYEETPESDIVEIAIRKRIALKGKPETREAAKKFFDYFMRQGFSYDLVNAKMREIAQAQIDDENYDESV